MSLTRRQKAGSRGGSVGTVGGAGAHVSAAAPLGSSLRSLVSIFTASILDWLMLLRIRMPVVVALRVLDILKGVGRK